MALNVLKLHDPARWAGLGKLLDLRPEIPEGYPTCPLTKRSGQRLSLMTRPCRVSRNRYLDAEQRQRALSLWHALQAAKQLYESGERNVHILEQAMARELLQRGAEKIDYARVVDSQTLETIDTIDDEAVALIACFVGKTRLIDNLVLSNSDSH